MARGLNCKEETIPFHYLGLPVGGSMNKAASWQPVIKKYFKSRLSNWKAKQLSFGGRLCLCKSVLGSLCTYFFSLYKAPKKVLNSIESIRCRFFWGGTDNEKKINWVAWDKILRDKLSGGLGVGSLKALNLAMLGKWWWRDRTESGAKWKVVNNCNATHSPNINSRGHRGVWRKIQEIDKDLRDMGINLDYLLQQKEDGSGWIWRLDANNNFTVSSLRKLIDSTSLPSAESETEWIKWVPSKANIHLWRTRCNRLATKDNLIKRGVNLQWKSVQCVTQWRRI